MLLSVISASCPLLLKLDTTNRYMALATMYHDRYFNIRITAILAPLRFLILKNGLLRACACLVAAIKRGNVASPIESIIKHVCTRCTKIILLFALMLSDDGSFWFISAILPCIKRERVALNRECTCDTKVRPFSWPPVQDSSFL